MKKFTILFLTFMLSAVCSLSAQTAETDSTRTAPQFWQKICRNYQMDNYFERKSHRRIQERLNEASYRYLEELGQIMYRDAYGVDYVQGIFAQVSPGETERNTTRCPAIDILQSPVPDAFILPNGTMLITTGLLCTLDSEEELKAVIATELAHYVLNHPGEKHTSRQTYQRLGNGSAYHRRRLPSESLLPQSDFRHSYLQCRYVSERPVIPACRTPRAKEHQRTPGVGL